MTRTTRRLSLALLSLAVLLTVPLLISLQRTSSAAPFVPSTITYELVWEWGDATPTADGWQVTTDLGYTVTVTEGYLVAAATQLIECDHSHAALNRSPLDAALSAWLPSSAEAGHGGDHDPSQFTDGTVEDLRQPANQVFGSATVDIEITYCGGHFLVVPAAEGLRNVPESLMGDSLYLAGTYQAPDSTEAVPFAIMSHSPNGTIVDLSAAGSSEHTHIISGAGDATVQIVRTVDSLVDGVDFAHLTDSEAGWAALRGVINATVMRVA